MNIRKGSLSRITAITVAIMMLFVTVAFANSATDMPDVAQSAHAEAITTLVEAEVIAGFPDGTFRPFNNLTRAEACIMIVRAIKPPSAELVGTATQTVPPSNFIDMLTGFSWADNYVSFAVRNNIVRGFPDGLFRPGNNVTNAEMATMILRAIGYTDAQIGRNWPYDFLAKAAEVGILDGLPEDLPLVATREVAAAMVFNKLDELRALGAQMEAEAGQEVEQEITGTGTVPWNVNNLVFANGRFNENITAFAGIPLSSDVQVFTYGIRNNFRQGMELPTQLNAFRRDTIHKYKNATTPAFYIMRGGEITIMIIPMDAGFTGRIYGVINEFSNTTNGRGEQVFNVHTLAAGQPITWLTQNNALSRPDSDVMSSGEVFEMTSQNGAIRDIRRATDPGSHNDFRELTPGVWTEVSSVDEVTITLANDRIFAVAPNATVYVLNADGQSYRTGRIANIRQGSYIRAFVISGVEEVATIITVRN